VLQIARNISRYLGLNEDLTEAIALGHDIGHTPFGHAGERVLDQILSGKVEYKELYYNINYTGFKHNFNSIKVLDRIEEKYNNESGLNLTWQVLEGILKHTKIKRSGKSWCDIDRFLLNKENNKFNIEFKKFLDYEDSITLEGQVVAIADEIAQRQHDLDDGMRDEYLGLKYKDIYDEVKKYIRDILYTYRDEVEPNFIALLEDLARRIEERDKGTEIFKRNTIIRDIIEYFICDVTLMSFKNVKEIAKKCQIVEEDRMIFTEKLINYSKLGSEFDRRLAAYIKNRIVNSNEVNKFDGKANYVIKRLFKAYYSNPRQMSSFALKRLSTLISENSEIYKIRFSHLKDKNGAPLEVRSISFSENEPEEVNNLMEYLKIEINIEELLYPNDLDDYFKFEKNRKMLIETQLEVIKNMSLSEVMQQRDCIKFIKCILEDHYAFLSVICDYISGMTDNYAEEEYRQLYQT
jgi:dGTPase